MIDYMIINRRFITILLVLVSVMGQGCFAQNILADFEDATTGQLKINTNYDCANAGQKMWAPLTLMNAVESNSLFTHSPRGTVTVSDKGETFFTPSPTGNIRYQLPGSKAWAAQMLEKIRKRV